MLSAARHTAKLSESSTACAFERKHFSQPISTSGMGNSTEYKFKEFLHLHKGKDCVVTLIDMQNEYFAIFSFPKSK